MTVAKSLEGANLVWQRVNEFLLTNNISPVSSAAFLRSLKQWLATQKGNPKLQYLSFSDVHAADVATVPELSTGGATLYALFIRKQNTATDSWFKINDSATVAGGASGANMTVTLPLLVGNDEVACIFTPGLVLATGIRVAAETTAAGGAATSTGDGPNGFAIVG
jgi:hypothetical protein